MKKISYLLFALLIVSCKSEESLEITTDEIDAYVDEKLGEDQMYDVSQSLRFAKENETYEVVRYMQNDTVILYLETHVTEDQQMIRQTFFMRGLPVYVDEYISSNITENPFIQRRVYLDGEEVMESFERSSAYEDELEYLEYIEANVDRDEFNFEKPDNAMAQQGDFEMKFEEFIIISPQTYLILENDESKYDVALFLSGESHPLLDRLFANPNDYKGRTIFVTHQFVLMNNIERMLFIDGYFVDEGTPQESSEDT